MLAWPGVPVSPADVEQPSEHNFVWGDVDGESFALSIYAAYEEIAHWRRNIFQAPSGSVGKSFGIELTLLFDAFLQKSAIESVAIHAAMTTPALLPQRPHGQSKVKENIACLERRLTTW